MALRYSLHRPSPSLWGRLARESPPLSINLRLFVEPPGGFENQEFRTDIGMLESNGFSGALMRCISEA
jgi:hypothetical protein